MKRRHNRLVIAIIVLMSGLYVGNLIIDNPYTHSLVNFYLNEQILKKLPIHAEYQSMKVELLPPAINIYGIKVTAVTDNNEETDLISISTLSFKASVWSIFMARPQMGDLELKDLSLTWPPPAKFMAALKNMNYTATEQRETAPVWPPVRPPPLSSLRISNATVQATLPGVSVNSNQDPAEVTKITADGLNLDLEIHDWKSFNIDIDSTHTSLTDLTSSYLEGGHLKLRGVMSDNEFKTRKLELSSPRLNLNGKLSSKILTDKKNNVIQEVQLRLDSENLIGDMSIIGSFLDISGNRGTFSGQAATLVTIPVTSKKNAHFSSSGHIKSRDARFFDFRLYETETDFAVDFDQFQLSNTSVKLGDTTVARGAGKIKLDKAVTFDFKLQPTNLPFKDLLGIFNVNFDVLNFNLTSPSLSIAGTGDPFKMSVVSSASLSDFSTPSVEYDHKRHPESPQCEMDLDLRVDPKELTFSKASGDCHIVGTDTRPGKFPLNISGFSGFSTKRGMNLILSSDAFNPAPLTYFAQASLEGGGKMKTTVHGPYDHIKVDLGTTLQNTIIGSTPVGTLSADIAIDDGVVSWTDVLIATPNGGRINSPKGSLQLNPDLDVEFDVSAKMIDHGLIGSAIRDMSNDTSSVAFVVKSLDGHFKGPVLRPLRWQGIATIDMENIQDRQNIYAKSLKGSVIGTETGYATENLSARLAGARVDIKATHSWDNAAAGSNFLSDLGLSPSDRIEIAAKMAAIPDAGDEIKLLPVLGKIAADNGISAQISGDAKFSGTLTKQTGIARLQLSKSKILNAPVSNIVSTIVVDGSNLDIMAEQGGSALKARVHMDVGDPTIPFNWYIAAKNADFRPWLPEGMSQDARNYAYLSATWNLRGTFQKWWESKGELEFKDLRLRYYSPTSRSGQRIDFRSAYPSRIYFDGKDWTIADNQPVTITSSVGEIRVGLKDHRPPSQIGLTIDGKVDVEALRLFTAGIETASGTIALKGGIKGSIENPNVDITVKNNTDGGGASDINLGFTGFRPSFQSIDLDATVKYNGINVRKLNANKGNGSIQSSGFLARPGSGEETDFTVNLDNASFLYPFPIVKYFDSSLDGHIKISGVGRPWNAAGRILIRKARSNRDVDIREAIVESLRSQSAVDSTESISPLMNLDISIAADKSIAFSSRSGQAQLSADLRVGGTNITPSILGMVDVPKGRFFYKRDFEIKRGLINFDDPVKADPALDISATSDVSSYRVGINITGRASAPSIDFTIDPPTRPDGTALSKMEIIGLLSRGSLSNTQSSQGSSESAAAAEALNLLAGQVEDTVQKIFDLSGQNVIKQVYIDTYADVEGQPVARFNLPLNIAEDFDVILKVDKSNVNVSSEYSLHDSISVTGGIESSNDQGGTGSKATGTPADTGVDLKFKFAFP